ncbi:sensor histidine kinase [Cryptosporangium arvum]|uniref:Signal transduction histidine kinase n=1 Tax=Cryptosporangium arvum DSM 44712 TaxID=927661 RepID=A0A010YHA7_9ACTN|nr:sensor histidine kinase [Cryptosporangium arvum]EXG79660.1 signal transduction histidine kinase [Cryptosporangium arvum DSM 44712]
MTSTEPISRANAAFTGRPRMARFGWLFGGIWLFYLVDPAQVAWEQDNVVLRVLGLAALLAFALWYLGIFTFVRSTRFRLWEDEVRRSWTAIGVLVLLAALTVPASGSNALATFVYISAASMMVLPLRYGIGVAVGLLVLALALDAFVPGYSTGAGLIFGIVVSALAIWGVRQMIERNVQLIAAQETVTQLAIAEERARTARDLHDILGHSLTVITVKAELAGRLIRADPDRAEREVADLERLSREALADVRRTVSGYRAVTLAGEIVSARVALDAAGIDAQLPIALDEVPGERRELFGWVVREGVTNVIRHAAARRCVVTVARGCVEVADDGRGAVAASAVSGSELGNGLTGLRERVETAGGTLVVGRSDLGGFLLRVTLGGTR